MRRFTFVAILALAAVGCHSQVPPNPTVYTCPATTGTAYAQIGTPTALNYTDTHPAAGTYCYIVQSTLGSQISVPSNIAGPFTTSGSNSVALTWSLAGTGATPTGFDVSRAPATQSTIFAPTLVNGTLAEVKPALPVRETKQGVYALLTTPILKGSVR